MSTPRCRSFTVFFSVLCCVWPDVTIAGSNCIGQFSLVYVHFSLDWLFVGDLLFSWNTDICLTFFQQWTVRTPIIIRKNVSPELNGILFKVALSMCRLIVNIKNIFNYFVCDRDYIHISDLCKLIVTSLRRAHISLHK